MTMIFGLVRRALGGAGLAVVVAAATAVAPVAPAVAGAGPAAITNLIKNGSFETPISAGATQCGSTSVSTGKWQPYSQTAGFAPVRVSSPVHSGAFSLAVSGPALGGCSAYGAYQDLASGALPAGTSFTFSAWIYPVTGTQAQYVLYPWVSRDAGGPNFSVIEDLPAGTVQINAWGTTATVSHTLTTNAWHHVVLDVDAAPFQAALSIDGKNVGTTPAGSSFPAAAATVFIGQPSGTGAPASDFDYDQVSLTRG
jgi:Concanavalin A-like lectin/glucanases superfamily